MRKRRCSLCGGKLVDNICIECGLDNTKNDEMYRGKINTSACDHKSMTHVHEEEEPVVKSYQPPKSKAIKKEKKKGRTSLVVAAIAMILTLGPAVFGLLVEIKDTYMGEQFFEIGQGEPEFYTSVTRELSEDGFNFDITLEPGIYQVGVHIPEGTYTATLEDGYVGYMNLMDEENNIYYVVSMGAYEGAVEEQDDIRLYDGAILEVSMGMKVKMHSENAQVAMMHGMENPVVQEVVLHNNVRSGVDFEPGVYDISFEEISPDQEEAMNVTYTPSIEDMQNGVMSNSLYFNEYEEGVYRNVALPEGTTVVFEGEGQVKLIPSAVINMNYN